MGMHAVRLRGALPDLGACVCVCVCVCVSYCQTFYRRACVWELPTVSLWSVFMGVCELPISDFGHACVYVCVKEYEGKRKRRRERERERERESARARKKGRREGERARRE